MVHNRQSPASRVLPAGSLTARRELVLQRQRCHIASIINLSFVKILRLAHTVPNEKKKKMLIILWGFDAVSFPPVWNSPAPTRLRRCLVSWIQKHAQRFLWDGRGHRMAISAAELICVFAVKTNPAGHELSSQFLRFPFSRIGHEDQIHLKLFWLAFWVTLPRLPPQLWGWENIHAGSGFAPRFSEVLSSRLRAVQQHEGNVPAGTSSQGRPPCPGEGCSILLAGGKMPWDGRLSLQQRFPKVSRRKA